MTSKEKDESIAAAAQSLNPQTNEEKGNIMPDEEKMEEAFKLTASHNVDDPKDKSPGNSDAAQENLIDDESGLNSDKK